MSTNLENRETERDREKEKVEDRPAKLNEKNSYSEREKKQRRHFLLEEQHEIL